MKLYSSKRLAALTAMVAILSLSISLIVAPSVDAAATTITYHADGTANDVSGTHNGTWNFFPYYDTGYTGASGDQSFYLGVLAENYIEMDTAVGTFGTDPATIDFWIKASSGYAGALQSVIGARSSCGDPTDGWFDIRVGTSPASNNPPGTLIVEFGDGTNYVNVIGQANVIDNEWHHVIVNRSSSGVSINVDGFPDGSGPSAAANVNPTAPFTIGRSACTYSGDGTRGINFARIDEINVTRGTPGVGPPINKDQCKNGGWATFTIPRVFKNQGDCIQFVNTGK